MKRYGPWIAGLVVLAAAASGWWFAYGRKLRLPAGPHAVFPVLRLDLGELAAGESGQVSFPVRSVGRDDLHIQDVEVECGCTHPEFPKTVASGGAGQIHVRLEAGVSWNGIVGRNLHVLTDDPKQPRVTLTILAKILPMLLFDPPSPLRVPITFGQVTRRTVTLTPRKGANFEIIAANSSMSGVSTVLHRPLDGSPDKTCKLDVIVGPVEQPGDFNSQLHVATTDPKMPTVSYMVMGEAQSGPVVRPTAFYMPTVDPKTPKHMGMVEVMCRSGTVRVTGASTDDPHLTASVRELSPGRSYAVNVEYTGGWPAGRRSGNFVIRTEDPRAPLLKVPYSVLVTQDAGKSGEVHSGAR